MSTDANLDRHLTLMRGHVPASIAKVAAGLRDLAVQMDRLAREASEAPDIKLPGITQRVVSDAMWGFANLRLENPAMWLEQYQRAVEAAAEIDTEDREQSEENR